MKRSVVLVAEHVGGAPVGSLRDPLEAAGLRLVIWDASGEPLPDVRYDGLLVLGGGANPDGSGDPAPLELERSLIREAHMRGVPVLGICLGAQLAAEALGGRARPASRTEHGWYEIELTSEASADPLLAGLDRSQTVMQWHAWAFEPPPGAVELARNAVCGQAFRVGTTTWGFQFHPEVTAAQLEEQIHARRATLRELGLSPSAMLADTRRHLPGQVRFARVVAGRFGAVVRAASSAGAVA